jgi:hypothetical protein
MGISVGWDNDDKTVIRWTLLDPWDAADFRAAFEQSQTLMKTVEHTVHILADGRAVTKVPVGSVMSNARMMIAGYPSNLGIHVAVSQNLLIRVIDQAVGRLLPKGVGKGIYAVETLDEAYALFAREAQKTKQTEPR